MNQGPRWVRLIEKSRGQKSRATVPLKTYCVTFLPGETFLNLHLNKSGGKRILWQARLQVKYYYYILKCTREHFCRSATVSFLAIMLCKIISLLCNTLLLWRKMIASDGYRFVHTMRVTASFSCRSGNIRSVFEPASYRSEKIKITIMYNAVPF